MQDKLSDQVVSLMNQYNHPIPSVTYLLCDRHEPNKVAFYYENAEGEKHTYTYDELSNYSRKFATVLRDLGVEKGHRVAILLPKGPELIISVLAIWRLGAIHVPLFTAFGPQSIFYRVENSGAQIIITDLNNRSKLNGTATGSNAIDTSNVQVITVGSTSDDDIKFPDLSFWRTLQQAIPLSKNTDMTKDDVFIILYTSGTTGHPKGVQVPVYALAAFEGYMRFGLDLKEDDIYWNMADPGWAYGLYFALVGPLLLGRTFILYNASFSVNETYRIFQQYQVTNFAAAPTVYRSMRAEGISEALKENLKLRVLSSAGEPLNLDVSKWAETNLGLLIHDHYGQTEQGMVINNHHFPLLKHSFKAGSMGQAMPGFRAVIVDSNGEELLPGYEGQIAIDIENSPLFWFRGYYQNPEKTAAPFINGSRYYLTGDSGSRDEYGYFYFSGRKDDIIMSAGYRIGPFEVESAIIAHEAVTEAAVVGVPDERRGEIVKAFVVLRPGFTPSNTLSVEISQFVKGNLSAHEYPREIEFVEVLPKTPSGKIQRYLLR